LSDKYINPRKKLRVHVLKKSDLRKEAIKNKWSAHAVAIIEKIIRDWLDSNLAQSVLLFFKEDMSGDLYAYMPLVSEDHGNLPDIKDHKGAKGEAKIIGVEPYPVPLETSNYALRSEDNDIIIHIMKDNNWNGTEVFRMSEKGSYQEYDISEVPSWETIGYGKKRIIAIKAKTGKTPAHLVRAVEMMEREYNEAIGYAACQMEAHSINIKLDEILNKGRFYAEDLIRIIEQQFELFKVLYPGNLLTILLAGFVPGSSCLLGDFEISPDASAKIEKAEIKEKVVEVEKRMSSVVQATPVLIDKSKTPVERIKKFQKETGLSNEDAYAAIHTLSKLRTSKQTIKLYAKDPGNREKPQSSITINGEANTQFLEIKRTLAGIIKPENERQLTGKIVELHHHKDDDLKFGIYVEDEDRPFTIHYPAKEDQKVRAKKGEVVTVVVLRDGPNKPWYFSKWVR
jgi:hypothetical protein